MNKAELVEQVAQKSELSRREAESAVDAALRTIEEQLAKRHGDQHHGVRQVPRG